MGGQRHAPAALPPGKTRYPLYRWLGERQSRSGEVQKISPPPEFDPRTVQPVASCYNNYAVETNSAVAKRGRISFLVFQIVWGLRKWLRQPDI